MMIALTQSPTKAIVQDAPTNPETFLRWAEGREGRFELAGGEVTMMVGATIWHEVLCANIVVLLRRQLPFPQSVVVASGLAVRVNAGIRYPDVLVHEGAFAPNDLVARNPVLVVEVLSPSSLAVDLIEKPGEYGAIESVAAYLAFAQEEPRALVWRRTGGDFPPMPEEVAGSEAAVGIAELGVTLPLAEVYAGLPDR